MIRIPQRLVWIVFCCVLSALPAAAQLVPLAEGNARALALGRATTALGGDVWGLYNPASWSTLQEGTVALFASQAFGMSELRVVSIAVAHPTPYGVASGYARTYGFEDFRESVFGVGFGHAFNLSATRQIHVGAALRYTSVMIPDFDSPGALGLSLGVLVEVMPGLNFGAHGLNINRPKLSSLDPLETRLDAGLSYRAHERALVVMGVSKDLDFPLSVRGGLEVQPVDVFFVRAGFSTEPTRFSTGVGVLFSMIRADLAIEHHEVLGWTPAFEVAFSW